MMDAEVLMVGAFAVPIGMLLACLWPAMLARMPRYLLFAPTPALATALLVGDDSPLLVGSTRLHLSFAIDLPGALLLGGAALLWIASGAYARPYLAARLNQGRFVVSGTTASGAGGRNSCTPPAPADQAVTIGATAPGSYVLEVHLRTSDGRALPPVMIDVVVTS